MPKLKRTEWRTIDSIFDMTTGYVLDFSDRTMSEWFDDEFGINIYAEKYCFNGLSKAKHLRAFIEVEPIQVVAPVLRALLNYRNSLDEYRIEELAEAGNNQALERILERLSKAEITPSVQRLDEISTTFDLDTVRLDLNRALCSAEVDPEDAVTSACSMVESLCRSILIELDLPIPAQKDLKALYKAVREPLGLSPNKEDVHSEIKDDVRKILSGLTTVVEGIAALRTHGGDAHGRERGRQRVDHRIATLAIHSASSLALFLIETWQRKYPTKKLHRH